MVLCLHNCRALASTFSSARASGDILDLEGDVEDAGSLSKRKISLVNQR